MIRKYIKQGLSAKEVSEALGIKTRKAHYLANKEGLHFKRKSKYNIDYKLFNEKLHTENTYYLLGYLFADGYVNESKGSINITSKDKEILEKISPIIGDVPIKENSKGCYYIQWYSKKHIKELNLLGCSSGKSLTLTFPTKLKSELINHFIRGYFDGDGSIGIYNRKDRPSKVLKVSIAGTFDFLDTLKRKVDYRGSLRKLKNSSIYILEYSGNVSAANFCQYIYKDSTVKMERKFKIFRGFI